jgi:hypothetical protein
VVLYLIIPLTGDTGRWAVVPDGICISAVPGITGLVAIANVGLPATPSPFVIVIWFAVPVSVRVAHVLVPVLTAIPLVAKFSTANKSFANAKVNVPVVVMGDPVMVRPAAGCVAATDVTPVLATVIEPTPFVTLIPVPAVIVARVNPVPLPMSI